MRLTSKSAPDRTLNVLFFSLSEMMSHPEVIFKMAAQKAVFNDIIRATSIFTTSNCYIVAGLWLFKSNIFI